MRVLGGLIVLLVLWHYLDLSPPPTEAILAPNEPDQRLLSPGQVAPWTFRGYRILPLATYLIKARVLHRESYYLDREADISPLDLALGWGPMSNPKIYDCLNISQSTRWYYWAWYGQKGPPLPEDQIEHDSANTHIIPGSVDVDHRLSGIRTGDVVQLTGYLIEADGKDDWRWRSSLSRDDTGAGACELMWVCTAEKTGR